MSRIPLLVSLLVAALLAVPAGASAHERSSGGLEIELGGGATTLALDPAAASALTGLGLTVAPIDPAAVTDAGIAFPITRGEIDLGRGEASISHAGGLRISSATTAVEVLRPRIVLDRQGLYLSVRVAGGPRIKLADLGLSKVRLGLKGSQLTVADVVVKLSDEAAAALNGAFGTDALAGGLVLGTATVATSIEDIDVD